MARDRYADRKTTVLLVSIGATLGLTTGVLLWRTGLGRRGPARAVPARIEEQFRALQWTDSTLRTRSIEAGFLADGILELTGSVRDSGEAQRAVALGQRIPGVRTVLNRLDIEILEDHLADTRQRYDETEVRMRETRWYGIGVGMGRRRQAASTDPDRPDDRVPMVSRELGAHRAVENTSERLDKIPAGVEGHTVLPAGPIDRGTVDHASHRGLGNEPVETTQDLDPASRIHENVKIGTELTLEKSGLEQNLEERGLEDRS